MFVRITLESLRRGRRRKLLALAAVAVGTLAASTLAGLVVASGDELAASLDAYGANLRVVPAAGRSTLPASELENLDTIFWRNNLVAVAPLYEVRVEARKAGPPPADAASPSLVADLLGSRFADWPGLAWRGLPGARPSLPVEGRWPLEGADEVVLGRRLAQQIGAARGDTVEVALDGRSRSLAVTGVATGGGAEEEIALVPLAVAEYLGGQLGEITGAEILALTVPETDLGRRDPATLSPAEYDAWYCTAYPSAVAFQVAAALPGAEAHRVRSVTEASSAVLLPLRQLFLGLAALVLACAFLGVAAAMAATVLERRPEMALLSALGSRRSWILRFQLTEAAILGSLGGLLGGLGGLWGGRLAGRWLFDTAIATSPTLLPWFVLAGAAVAIAGTLTPLRRALRTAPATVLQGGLG